MTLKATLLLLLLAALMVLVVSCGGDTAGPLPTYTPYPTEPTATADYSNYDRRTPFVPLDNPAFLAAEQATYLPGDDLVLGLVWEDEARAYPIRMLRFHHIVNDRVSGRPILITY